MNEPEVPPLLDDVASQPSRSKWRWALHLLILGGYVLGLGIVSAFIKPPASEGGGSAMPRDLPSLVSLCAREVLMFSIIFGLAWTFSRVRARDLFLKWRGGFRPIWKGFLYSIGLRLMILVFLAVIMIPISALKGKESVDQLRPKVEELVDTEALKDPMYVLFAMTAISFGMAGFREELWRAAMMAGFAGLAPAIFTSRKGQLIAVTIAAIIFGFGHLPQGIGGVLFTTALGLALGWIILRHQSIWEAVMAHGFFDATTFAALYIVARFYPDVLKNLAIFA